jgi:polyhydroxyalkanoate synthesis regulator phasin
MDFKKKLMSQGMKLMSDPRFMKLMQDERFAKVMANAITLPGKIQTFTSDQKSALTKAMGMASEDEVKDLRRTVRALEDQISQLKKQSDAKDSGK